MVRAFLFLLFLLAACFFNAPNLAPSFAPTSTPRVPKIEFNTLRVGWAYEAYPEVSADKLRDDFARMRENGATAVWIGHNNPGQVDASKVEPGMSYAVYAALQNENDPLHGDAVAMADAVKRALVAARETHLQVILPIGYQIQMGNAWDERYPNDLRTNFDGTPLSLYNSGFTASPYSAQYRAAISRYYQWIQTEWVAPYQDVIVMLSLADEPMGGDYSDAAKQEFARRYGKEMSALSQNEAWQVGEFESGVIADYAAWSANEWKRLNPNILTTMSFHGGETARRAWGLPDIEKLFAQTPDNFIVTFDAYLHDDLPTKPATPKEAAELKLFLRTIGNYSRVYSKPIALWGGANAWGLAQESGAPLGLTDAVTNLQLLYDLPVRAGGTVWGIFAWNYNVKQQGLENYTRPTTYEPQALEVAVSRAFPLLRTRQPPVTIPPEAVIVASPRAMYNELAASRAADIPPAWIDMTPYAQEVADRNVIFAASPKALEAVRDANYFILEPRATWLDSATQNFLRARLQEGRNILAADDLLAREWGVPTERWTKWVTEFPSGVGTFYVFGTEE